jgi:hypothetical protein
MGSFESVLDTLRWCLGVLGIWAVVSIPAYAVLTVWLQLRTALSSVSHRLSTFVDADRARRKAESIELRQELKGELRWYDIDQTASTAWRSTVSEILREARANAEQLATSNEVSRRAVAAFEPIVSRLRRVTVGLEALPVVPDVSAALLVRSRQRVAIFNFICASVLLLIIFALNAQMTGLVLSEILPRYAPLLGIPIPFLIAFAFVVLEASVGFMHSVEAESRTNTERVITLAGITWLLAGAAVVAVETVMYGLVNTENVSPIPVAGSVFGLMGGLLGFVVVGLGRLWHHSFVTLRKEGTPKALRKEFSRLREAADHWAAIVTRIGPDHQRATEALERLVETSKSGVALQLGALQKVRIELEQQCDTLPSWATARERILFAGEFDEREARAYQWFVVWVLGTIAVASASGAFGFRLSLWSASLIGVGLATTTLSLGALVAQATLLESRYRIIILHVSLVLLIFAMGLATGRILRGLLSIHGGILATIALSTYVAGVQLGTNLTLVQMPLRAIERLARSALFVTALATLWIVVVAVEVVTYAVQLLAWPVTTVVRAFRRPEAPTPVATV